MIKGFDSARPILGSQARALAGQGMGFAARYLVPVTYSWKRLIRGEAEALTAAGLRIVSVFETGAGRPAGGAAAGEADGSLAFLEAKEIRQPIGSAIYAAVDYDAQAKHFDAIEAYLRAFAKEIPGYKLGVYGSYDVVEEMADRKAAAYFWQTYAWSGGKRSSRATLYQYQNGASLAGASIDLDEATGDIGAWDTRPVIKEDEKGEDVLELSKYQRDTLIAGLEKLIADGTINDKTWVEKAKSGSLTLSELAWLSFILAIN